jgi:hypothetical protein
VFQVDSSLAAEQRRIPKLEPSRTGRRRSRAFDDQERNPMRDVLGNEVCLQSSNLTTHMLFILSVNLLSGPFGSRLFRVQTQTPGSCGLIRTGILIASFAETSHCGHVAQGGIGGPLSRLSSQVSCHRVAKIIHACVNLLRRPSRHPY